MAMKWLFLACLVFCHLLLHRIILTFNKSFIMSLKYKSLHFVAYYFQRVDIEGALLFTSGG